jgi:threonine synthase
VSVQAEGCAPVVKAFREGAEVTVPWPDASTRAYGLRVPAPLGGFLCLRALRETKGTAVAIPEERIGAATRELAARTGIDVCPEGGAAWAAAVDLRRTGWIAPTERVVVFNTGTGLKYREGHPPPRSAGRWPCDSERPGTPVTLWSGDMGPPQNNGDGTTVTDRTTEQR